MEFRDILKDLRFEKNVTQGVVAKSCGLTPTCICQLETGARNPTGSTIIALAKYFDVSADYLLGLEDDFGARTTTGGNVMRDTNTAQERELLELFRTLSPYLKGMTMEAVKSWAKKGADGEQKKV